jgi:ABC-2 type transport system permease protein
VSEPVALPNPQADPRPAGRARRVRAMARMELRLLLRNGENLLVTFAIPVAALGMAAALPALPASEQPPGQLVGGALAVAVFAAAFVALPITTAFARDANVLKRLGVSPLSRGDLVAAKLLALALVAAGQVALVVITGVAIGWGGPPEPAAAAVALLIVVPLLAAGAAGVGLALAGRLPPMRVLAVVNVVFVFALLNSGLVVPVGELPVWLQTPALALPVAPATSALAWLLTPGAQPVLSWSVTAPPLMVWGLGGPLAAVALFCWWDE